MPKPRAVADPHERGLLATVDGNQSYWERPGNPDGIPVVYLLCDQRTTKGCDMSEQNKTVSFYTISDLPSFSPVDGITMQAIMGEKMMANWVWLEPGTEMPTHDHPHEQVGVVLQGALELTTPDEVRVIEPGQAYVVPGSVPHKGVPGPDGCLVLDVFSPPREEYAEMARGQS